MTSDLHFFRKILLTFWLALPVVVVAQSKPTIRASVNKNRILLGEPFTLTIEARIPGGSVVKPIRIDSIRHFEFLEKPGMDTSSFDGGIQIRGVYTLTSFDSGHWVIPSYSLASNIRTDTIPMDVVFSEFNPEQDYHDIKDIIGIDEEKKRSKWWLFAAGGALLLAMILLLLRKKKPKPVSQVVPGSVYDEAMAQLNKLRSSPPPAKEYYTRLIDIFKLYVYRKKGILSLQKTTDDLVVQLKDLSLPKETYETLAQSFRLGDFVKFAKYVPSPEDDQNSFAAVKKAIDEIEQLK